MFGSAGTGSAVSANLRVSIPCSFSPLTEKNVAAWDFFMCSFSGTAIFAKVWHNWLKDVK